MTITYFSFPFHQQFIYQDNSKLQSHHYSTPRKRNTSWVFYILLIWLTQRHRPFIFCSYGWFDTDTPTFYILSKWLTQTPTFWNFGILSQTRAWSFLIGSKDFLLPEESPPLDAPSPSDDDANEEEATDEDLLAIGQRSQEQGEHQDKGTK